MDKMAEGLTVIRFSDEALETITCESTWRRGHVDSYTSSAQTSDVVTFDVGMMCVECHDVNTQTKQVSEALSGREEPGKFIECVRRAGEKMLEELCKAHSKAFDDYYVTWDDEMDSVYCLLSMNEADSESFTSLPVTALSWNATGSVLAAGFGYTDHSDWCYHKTRISTWNITRHDQSSRKPDNTCDIDSCVTCLTYHPTIPAVLAVGTYTGTVLMWDLVREEGSSVLMSSSQRTRGDTVAHIEWFVENRKSSIISISVSGQVCTWIIAQKGQSLTIQSSQVIHRTDGVKFGLKAGSTGTCVAAIDGRDTASFLVGTETGCVYKCERSIDKSLAKLFFQPHHGPVYGLHYSTLIRNIFVTCGTDGTVHIYSVLQASPLLILEPCNGYLYSCRWSPTNPSLLAVCGSNGRIIFYNLSSHVNTCHLKPYHVLECGEERSVVRVVEFNTKQTNLLASGDSNGRVKAWRLGKDFTNPSSKVPSALLSI